ncbi:MAG: formylglycine-generating enzyme family protein [Polyangiaceae bacterium]|nr:formylglycine-generating enzyme family protein [Polyangiaceae bacterium]
MLLLLLAHCGYQDYATDPSMDGNPGGAAGSSSVWGGASGAGNPNSGGNQAGSPSGGVAGTPRGGSAGASAGGMGEAGAGASPVGGWQHGGEPGLGGGGGAEGGKSTGGSSTGDLGGSATGGTSLGGAGAGAAGEGGADAGGGAPSAGAPTAGAGVGGASGQDIGGAAGNGEVEPDVTSGCTMGEIVGCPTVNATAVLGPRGPSCDGESGHECNGESCCTSLLVPGCTFAMGRSETGCDEDSVGSDDQPEHDVTVESFYLDKYEVTVQRFRAFVESQVDGGSWAPAQEGDGAHPGIAGSGWQKAWDEELPTNRAVWDFRLCADDSIATWTSTPGSNETKAIISVDWYEAMAFCVWDGGRLPTEAEWEYAAAGGDENRRFPWGSVYPANDCVLANWAECSSTRGNDAEVGQSPQGAGRWGHQDLAGNVAEWVLDHYRTDWYSAAGASGTNPCNLTPSPGTRASRGGTLWTSAATMRAASRVGLDPGFCSLTWWVGFRCARNAREP